MIKIGDSLIGDGAPVFIAAEIGINHNGDRGLGCEMIKAAIDSGADAVKFQNYFVNDFIIDKSLTYKYLSQGVEVEESQYKMFKRYELSFDDLAFYKNFCDQNNILFFSTPTSKQGIDDLIKLDVEIFKNGSDFLVNLPLIEEIAQTNIPLIISTGMANEQEIQDAVEAFENAGGKDLIILHCTSSYPTPDYEINLKRMVAIKNKYNHLVGFSDHSEGYLSASNAVSLGACFIEKHFTLDKNLPGPDHRFSATPSELEQLVKAVRKTESLMGSDLIAPAAIEADGRDNFRLSCAASSALKQGQILSKNNIVFLRPATGVTPKHIDLLLGKKLIKDIAAGTIIKLEDVA